VEDVRKKVEEVYSACGKRHQELEEKRAAAAAAAAAAVATETKQQQHGRSRSLQSATSITSACDVTVIPPSARHSTVR